MEQELLKHFLLFFACISLLSILLHRCSIYILCLCIMSRDILIHRCLLVQLLMLSRSKNCCRICVHFFILDCFERGFAVPLLGDMQPFHLSLGWYELRGIALDVEESSLEDRLHARETNVQRISAGKGDLLFQVFLLKLA